MSHNKSIEQMLEEYMPTISLDDTSDEESGSPTVHPEEQVSSSALKCKVVSLAESSDEEMSLTEAMVVSMRPFSTSSEVATACGELAKVVGEMASTLAASAEQGGAITDASSLAAMAMQGAPQNESLEVGLRPLSTQVEAAVACSELAAVIGEVASLLESSEDDAHLEEAVAVNLRPLNTPDEAATACCELATVVGNIASTLATGVAHYERSTLLCATAEADAEVTLSLDSTDWSDVPEVDAEVLPAHARSWLSWLFCSRRATTTPKRKMQVAGAGLIDEPVLKRIRA